MKASAAATLATGVPGFLTDSLGATLKPSGKHEKTPPLAVVALNKMAFGPRPGDLDGFDYQRYVEIQLHPGDIVDVECENKISFANLPTLSKNLQQLWKDYKLAADVIKDAQKDPTAPKSPSPAGKANSQPSAQAGSMDEQKLRQQPVHETEIATWIRAVYSRRQLKEVLADFWHNHFNVFGWENQISPVFVHYDRDVIRTHLFGNFREMLEAVTKSPAMLFYLDNFINQSGNPNENFARELFELHTLGAENYLGTRDRTQVPGFAQGKPVGYVDGDVYEAARCLTGWRVDANQKEATNTGEFAYYDTWHDRFQKIVLGHSLKEYQPPLKDGHDVLDILAEHPGTARFVSRKLCRRLVSDNPPEKLVERVAKVFHEQRKAPDQLRQVVRIILLSQEFKSTWGEKLKRPFESTASLLRATDAQFFPSEDFLRRYQRAGQRLFQWRSPDGYPDMHARWGGTTPILERWKLANEILSNKVDGVKVDINSVNLASGASPHELAQQWSLRLLGRRIGAESLNPIVEFLSKGQGSNDRIAGGVALLAMSPEFQWR